MSDTEPRLDTPAILFEDVRLSFGPRAVLRGASGRVRAGSVIGLMGRNGEGKTTLFKILLDLLQAESGRAEILGRSLDGSGAVRQLAGFVPERPSFHDFMTAGEVFNLRSRFFANWDGARAAALARELDLDPAVKVRGASKGTLAKIAWVCAVAHDPKVLLLDEPTSGLDALVREEVLTHLIRELMRAGRTILVANHHMEELAGVLDEVWVMNGGRIAEVRPLDALRAEAKRVTGRLREGAAVPRDLAIHAAGDGAPLVDWRILETATLERIRELQLLEGLDVSPLPVEAALRALLARHPEEASHA